MIPLPPGSTIGILGSGQLGRMLALAAARLGLRCHVYADTSGPACDIAAASIIGAYEDRGKLLAFARGVDVVTYEFENVPLVTAAILEKSVVVRPGPFALAIAQNRLVEKQFVAELGIPVAPFAPVVSAADLTQALEQIGTPSVLKTQRMGYDGKGQVRVECPAEALDAWRAIGGEKAVLESWLIFACEISVLVVRSGTGEMRFYDSPVNTHENGILKVSTVPSGLSPKCLLRAQEIAASIAEALDYVGVLAVEMFYVGAEAPDAFIVNEIAPRVHNSGHWTVDACTVSQFENHIRAVAGWPLGATLRHSDARMTNLLGADAAGWAKHAAEPGACVHLYGKNDARPGRKMGHITRLSPKTC